MEIWKTLFDEEAATEAAGSAAEIHGRRPRQKRDLARPAAAAATSASRQLHELSEQSRRYFRLSVTNGWVKLNDYYTKLGESPLYTAAIILHPKYGLQWLKDHWVSDSQIPWVREAHDAVRNFWMMWYQPGDDLSLSSQAVVRQPMEPQTLGPSEFDDWMSASRAREPKIELEIDRYLALEPSQVQNPIDWWLAHREEFPTVSQWALDILAIPAMAADCERAFSLAKLTLTSQRQAMTPLTLEHLQCLKNWLRRGAVTLGQAFPRAPTIATLSTDYGTPPGSDI